MIPQDSLFKLISKHNDKPNFLPLPHHCLPNQNSDMRLFYNTAGQKAQPKSLFFPSFLKVSHKIIQPSNKLHHTKLQHLDFMVTSFTLAYCTWFTRFAKKSSFFLFQKFPLQQSKPNMFSSSSFIA